MERGPLSKDACVKNREFEPTAKVVGTLSEYVMSRMGLAGGLFWALNLGLDLGLNLGFSVRLVSEFRHVVLCRAMLVGAMSARHRWAQ